MTTPDDLKAVARECGAQEMSFGIMHFDAPSWEAFASRIASQKDAPQPAPVQQALTEEQIDAAWEGLPGICIHNDAAARGLNTQVMMRRAFARAVLASQARGPEARCPCGYPMPCSKKVPVGLCRSGLGSDAIKETKNG